MVNKMKKKLNTKMASLLIGLVLTTFNGYSQWGIDGSGRVVETVSGDVVTQGRLGVSIFPSYELDVNGDINCTTGYRIGGTYVLTTPGTRNIFGGVNSGISNTTGNDNSTLGYQSLYTNISGSENCGFGSYSLYLNSSGNSNSAFGAYSLDANTGSYNSAFGTAALELNTGGASNCAFGWQALNANNNGNYSAAFGDHALYSIRGLLYIHRKSQETFTILTRRYKKGVGYFKS
jgi:hypothetical protein